MKIKDIMKTDLFTLHENDTISDVSEVMKFKKIRHIPIVSDHYHLVGLVTHRDLLIGLAKKPSLVYVKDIMNKNVKAIEPETPLKGAIDVMIVNKFGCLPVVDKHRKLIGLVTEIDLLKMLYEVTGLPKDFYQSV